jgi:hypothetical protein
MKRLVALVAGLAAIIAACDRIVDLRLPLDASIPASDGGSLDDPLDATRIDAANSIDAANRSVDAAALDAGTVNTGADAASDQ